MNNKFNEIDINNWERKDEFESFIQHSPCTFSMTADVDITKLYNFSKQNNLKLYPMLVSVMSQVINEHKEYRYAFNDKNKFGYYEVLHPLFFDVIEETSNVKVLYAEYKNNIFEQVKEIEKNREKYKSILKYSPQKDMPKNVVNISCIPWVKFTNLSFSLPLGNTYFFPIITFGKFEKKHNKILIPLSIHINHSVNDGYHGSMIYKFFEDKVKNLDL